MSSIEFAKIKKKIGDFSAIVVATVVRSRGLALLWKNEIIVHLRPMFVHHIDVEINEGIGNNPGDIRASIGDRRLKTGIYPGNFWGELASQTNLPWMCLGDFNEILCEIEMKGRVVRAEWKNQNFKEAIDVCGFRDIPWSGYEFSYDNGRLSDDNV